MIKKLVVVMVMVAMSVFARAESRVVGGVTWYYSVTANAASIISGALEYTGALTIPSSLDGYPVTGIGSDAFYSCKSLTSVTIPSSVTSIGSYAFEYCSALTSVTIPSSVTSIGASAFYGCSALTSVTIPSSVTSIGASAFNGCKGLTSITVDSGNSFYSSWDGILFDKAQKELICHPRGKTGAVEIPSSVTSIGASAFSGCSGLTSVTIPANVMSIGASAFSGCSGLTSMTIPANVESIGSAAFNSCRGLTSITVDSQNSSYSSRDDILFDKAQRTLICCPGGKTGAVTIPTSVTNIGDRAFYSCSGLTSVTVPSSVTTIESHAFYYCSGLTSLKIPSSVESIGSYAFYSCSGLTSLTIPSSVTDIGICAFRGCDGLADANGFVIVNGVLYDYCGSAASVRIPSSVKSIGHYAFSGCKELTSMTIPSSVESIGSDAFSGCSGLTSVKIPSGVTSIGSYTFWNCTALKSVGIPDGVTSIGSYAFSGCSALTSVAIPDGVTSIGYSAFSGCSSLKSMAIPAGVTSIGSSAFSGCGRLTSVTIPACVSSMSTTFPDAYDKIRTLVICPGVTSIGNSAFAGCKGLTSVTIPAGVTSIGYSAFSACGRLADVYFRGAAAPDVAENAFEGCRESMIVHVPHEWDGVGDVLCGYPVVRDGSAGNGEEWIPSPGVWSSKYTFNGLVYDQGNVPCGLVQIATMKESAKGVKVKGFVMLEDGKKVSLKSVTVPIENGVLNVTTKVGKLGSATLTVGGDGFFGKLDSLKLTSAAVGEDTGILKSSVTVSYFEESTGKLKKKSFALGGIAVRKEAVGTLTEKKSKTEKGFYAEILE